MSKIKAISPVSRGIKGLYKSESINVIFEPNISSPIVYFKKPKWLTDKQFNAVVDDIISQISGLSEKTANMLEGTEL